MVNIIYNSCKQYHKSKNDAVMKHKEVVYHWLLLPPITVVCVCVCALHISGLIRLCANYSANFSAASSSGLIWGGLWDNLSLSVCDALAQFKKI